MEVILLEKVRKLGELGDRVRVKPGYGRNFLVPQKKAVPATSENIKLFEERRAEFEAQEAETRVQAQQRAEGLTNLIVEITAKAGPEGKLFGSVGTKDIADAMVAAGHSVEKHEVLLPDGPLRDCGAYAIALQLHADVTADVRIHVLSEDGTTIISDGDEAEDDEDDDSVDPDRRYAQYAAGDVDEAADAGDSDDDNDSEYALDSGE